jgi:hypothetical protein
MSGDDDDKPTVVLDLNALKKQKLKQEEDLAAIVQDLEFAVGPEEGLKPQSEIGPKAYPVPEPSVDSEEYAEQFLAQRAQEKSAPKLATSPAPTPKSLSKSFKIILFDFQSDFFQKSQGHLPKGFDYHIAKSLPELNKFLQVKGFQIVLFNYDVNPKAVNQLTAQIKQKFPSTKTMIMARNISPEKARIHAKTPSGANGYYQFPLEAKKVESEFQKIYQLVKKVS